MVAPHCPHCLDEGFVCEEHPQFPWEGTYGPVDGHSDCGGAGMPCPACCSPIPEDGTHSISEAFVPDWRRGLALFRRGTKKATKPRKPTRRKPVTPAARRRAATPAPKGAVKKPRQTARPKPATAPA